MITRVARARIALVSTLILGGSCSAIEATGLEAALRHCAADSDASTRLACFDAVTRALPGIENDRFGLTEDIKRKRDPVAVQRAKEESVSASIVDLRQGQYGEWTFTLDNGQVWKQTEPRANITFKVGESVRLEHGAMSSLWLAAENHRKVRVKRLQ